MIGARPALVSVLVGALGALAIAVGVAAPTAAPAPSAPVAAAPAAAVAAPVATTPRKPAVRPVTAAPRTMSRTASKAARTEPSAAECTRIAQRSSLPNVELRPHLRSMGCDDAADGLLVGAGAGDEESTSSDGASSSSSGSEDRDGNGVINGWERCGTSCGEEPTSGELQYQDGCEQGYIPASEC